MDACAVQCEVGSRIICLQLGERCPAAVQLFPNAQASSPQCRYGGMRSRVAWAVAFSGSQLPELSVGRA